MKAATADCLKALLPNFVTEWLGAPAAAALGWAGISLGPPSTAAFAVAGLCVYLACSLRQQRTAQRKEELDRKAVQSIRKYCLDGKNDHAALVAQLNHLGYDLRLSQAELNRKIDLLETLAKNPTAAPHQLDDFFRTQEGLFISLSEFIEANFGEVKALITAIAVMQKEQATKQDVASLREEMRLIREALENKPPPGRSDAPPPVAPQVIEAAYQVQNSAEASLLARTEAAIVSRSPEAGDYLDRLDEMVDLANYKRRQLRGDYHYFRGEYDLAIEPYEAALKLRPEDFTARNNTANAHNQAHLGDVAAHRKRAIALYQGMLDLVLDGSADWAMTQRKLGSAWSDLPTGDRAQNVQDAIDCYTRALRFYTRADYPVDWAITQNNLAVAWRRLPTGDPAQNLQNAMACYTEALKVYDRALFPTRWAITQNNLGIAWRDLSTGNRAQNVRNAIACFTQVLDVFNRDNFPAEWAAAQNNLGNAWRDPPAGDPEQNIRNAIDCYARALQVYTRTTFPALWAMTQNDLGTAWRMLPAGDRAQNLRTAIDCYTGALEVRTRAAFPARWAMTQNNLGVALAELAELPSEDRCLWLRQAIASGKAAMAIYTAEGFPHDHADTVNNLINHRKAYESAGCASEIPFDDIALAE